MPNNIGAGGDVEPLEFASRHSADGRAASGGAARPLAPAAFRSLDFAALEDEAIWIRSWVSVGFADEIAAPGDILPFTVGQHGVHVERLANGGLVGRFNKAQHGGCRVVPLQCQTGAKTKCSFTACGHSRDRRPIAAGSGDADRTLDQYLGLRPERLLPVVVKAHGDMIAVNLDPFGAQEPDWPAPLSSLTKTETERRGAEATHWVECDADWKLLLQHLAAGEEESSGADFIRTSISLDSGAQASATVLFPNAVVVSAVGQRCMIILQPTALGRTLCRIRISGDVPAADAYQSAVALWLAEMSPRMKAAEAAQAAIRFDPTDPASEDIARGPFRHRAAPAAWLESKIDESILSRPAEHETYYATSRTGRR